MLPELWVRRLRTLLVDRFPECVEEDAWVGVRWRVGQATIAHAFGGEDGLFRITFRAEAHVTQAPVVQSRCGAGVDWWARVSLRG